MTRTELILEIERLIVAECQKSTAPEAIGNNDLLFGADAPLVLDSLMTHWREGRTFRGVRRLENDPHLELIFTP